MKTSLALIFIFFSFNLCISQEFISSRETSIIDENGKSIQMNGVCLANWLVPEGYMLQLANVDSPRKINTLLNELIGEEATQKFWEVYLNNYITKKDIQFIKNQGFDHVRLYLHYKFFTENDYLGQNYHGFEHIDNIIKWCKESGLYVLLDMHCAPCGQSGENYDDSFGYPGLYKSEFCQELMISIWKKIAERYKDNSTVMGYDILNAPLAPLFEEEMKSLNDSLLNLYKKTIRTIRSIDQNHLIFVQFPEYHENLTILNELEGEHIVFTFQRYFVEPHQNAVQKYLDFGKKHQAPIYVCEFGENSLQWTGKIRQILNDNRISWCYHPYKEIQRSIFYIDLDEPSSIVGIKKPENWNIITDYGISDRSSFPNIRDNKPPIKDVKRVLNEFLENIKFENCIINNECINELGLD
ncbi:MAG: hypothetical protein DHS20C13_28310 [Thermodesulfobacteriota bacterium]|nr:MAG: hypothetical protein DHS20C13_28310 [Thermodesulfobacteriota bacterium]